jgi:hypothetical protein
MPKLSKIRARSQVALSRRFVVRQDDYVPPASKEWKEINAPSEEYDETNETIELSDIADLFEMCKNECPLRHLSVLICMILKHFKVNTLNREEFMKSVGCLTSKTAEKWLKTFIHGDYNDFQTDNRGGKKTDSFYDQFPEIEIDAKAYVAKACAQKSASFAIADLSKFVDDKFYETTGQLKTDEKLVRSESMCRLDVRRWGFRFGSNNQRPYFEGHERPDVLAHRKEFIDHFLTNEENYYSLSDGDNPKWIAPKAKPTILICMSICNLLEIVGCFPFLRSRRIDF